jgi:hypothetical protein
MTTRRDFVIKAATASAALALPRLLEADPYQPLPVLRGATTPVRIRGRVVAAGRGVAGARVSDGRTVFRTTRTGEFDFVTSDTQHYLTVCPPRGYALPTQPSGTTRLFAPIAPGAGGEMTHRFDLVAEEMAADTHGFFVLADPQTQNAFEMARFHAETVPDVLQTRSGLTHPTFGIGCGDLMFDDLSLYPEYERAVTRMGMPFVQVVGNHDLDQASGTTEGATATFEGRFGASHYSFDRGRAHYIVLNNVFWHGAGYLGYLTEEQLAFVKSDLSFVEAGMTVIVFLHIPLESTQYQRSGPLGARPAPGTSTTNREILYRMLEGYRSHVIAGHTHESEHRWQGKLQEHVAGAVCGAWWSGDICHDGTPNGYAVYEVSGESVSWHYKSTGQPRDHQMALFAPGSEPTAPGDLIANVWDWDPSWTVTWFEDGAPRGLMSRRRGLDPQTVQEHRGPDKPVRRTWVEPVVTNHLFYAAASPSAREFRVEAKDGFGRTYSKEHRRSSS